jgi:hypothetical protein
MHADGNGVFLRLRVGNGSEEPRKGLQKAWLRTEGSI